ncbi:hypothetical protein T492DRAFT_208994 [Pavlovales sp. CCMP2436]|nr:hypothetical protein T492DRAFT_208994 [Pavlovales sp. CCMP2436]
MLEMTGALDALDERWRRHASVLEANSVGEATALREAAEAADAVRALVSQAEALCPSTPLGAPNGVPHTPTVSKNSVSKNRASSVREASVRGALAMHALGTEQAALRLQLRTLEKEFRHAAADAARSAGGGGASVLREGLIMAPPSVVLPSRLPLNAAQVGGRAGGVRAAATAALAAPPAGSAEDAAAEAREWAQLLLSELAQAESLKASESSDLRAQLAAARAAAPTGLKGLAEGELLSLRAQHAAAAAALEEATADAAAADARACAAELAASERTAERNNALLSLAAARVHLM